MPVPQMAVASLAYPNARLATEDMWRSLLNLFSPPAPSGMPCYVSVYPHRNDSILINQYTLGAYVQCSHKGNNALQYKAYNSMVDDNLF